MSILKQILDTAIERFEPAIQDDRCGVEGCNGEDVALVKLLAFDPIDHGDTYVPLCEDHQDWADERNEFARSVYAGLRECRSEVGHARKDEVVALQSPPDGEIAEGTNLTLQEEAETAIMNMVEVHNL